MNLSEFKTEDLERELKTRSDRNLGRCETCGGKWSVYMGCSDSWREKPHCSGCRRPVQNCNCGR